MRGETSPRQANGIGCLAQAGLSKAVAGRVVEEDAVFLARPDGVGFHEARSLYLEEKAAWPAGTGDDGLVEGGLTRVELIVAAQYGKNVRAQFLDGGETNHGIHTRVHYLRCGD